MYFTVAVNIVFMFCFLFCCSSAVQKSSGNWAAEEIATAVKQGRFNDDTFTADPSSVRLSVDYLCQDGQVLRVVEADNITRTCCKLCLVKVMIDFMLSVSSAVSLSLVKPQRQLTRKLACKMQSNFLS